MKLLVEINDKDAGTGEQERFDEPYTLRKAVRAVLFNDKGELAFQRVNKLGYHKLPGGGIDDGEDMETALRREIREEVGCDSEIGDEVGVVIEYRNGEDRIQISYCYFAKVVGAVGEPSYEQDEIEEGHEPLWTSIDEAIRLLGVDEPTSYDGHFIIIRDRAVLKEAKRQIENRGK